MTEFIGTRSSWLFVPGDRPDRFSKAADSGAGGIIIDLEDAVSADSRPKARDWLADYLRQPCPVPRWVRIGAPRRGALRADLDATAQAGAAPDAVMVPKVESAEQLQGVAEESHSLFGARIPIIALIESAKGALAAPEIADAADALMVGEADLAADLGCATDSARLAHASFLVLLAANSRQLPAIASPWFSVRDTDGLDLRCRRDASDGYFAKTAIHPSQIPAIERAFRPSAESVAWAESVNAARQASAVSIVDGQMLDEAMARRARWVLSRSRTPTGNN